MKIMTGIVRNFEGMNKVWVDLKGKVFYTLEDGSFLGLRRISGSKLTILIIELND